MLTGAFDFPFAGVLAFADLFGAEVLDRFGLIHLLSADQPLAFPT